MCITVRSNRCKPISLEGIVPQLVQPVNSDAVEDTEAVIFDNPELIGNEEEVRQPKRRRRAPQKPGFTAKGEVRHFVQHQYKDHADDGNKSLTSSEEHVGCDDDRSMEDEGTNGTHESFPIKLFHMLSLVESLGISHVISWLPHGRAFAIHKPKAFAECIMPKYFSQTKLTSFQRQLNLYGFTRLTRMPDHGGYYHEFFLRGRPSLVKNIMRTKVKGTKFKATSSPETEPDFYRMPYVFPLSTDDRFTSRNQPGILDTSRKEESPMERFIASIPSGSDSRMRVLTLLTPKVEDIFSSDDGSHCSRDGGASQSYAGSLTDSSLSSDNLDHAVVPSSFVTNSSSMQIEPFVSKHNDYLKLDPIVTVPSLVKSQEYNSPRYVPITSLRRRSFEALFCKQEDPEDPFFWSQLELGIYSDDVLDDLVKALEEEGCSSG